MMRIEQQSRLVDYKYQNIKQEEDDYPYKIESMKRKVYGLFIAVMMLGTAIAQETRNENGVELSRMHFQAKQVIGPSPEAAELGKYGNVPVSLFSGTPQILVPLFELKGKNLSLPVSFSYNSGGFKPEDIAPWTGLGWALNAGGVITRAVQGDPDMDGNYFLTPSPIRNTPWDELNKQQYIDSIRMKDIETQPDVYYYNFMGHSGKFFLHPDGSVVQKEKGFLKISNWGGDYGDFTIIDENGVRYIFEKQERTSIVPYVYFDPVPGGTPPATPVTFTSAWYLTRVMTPYGNEQLNFEYYSPYGGQVTSGGALKNQSITYSRVQTAYNSYWQTDLPSSTIQNFEPPFVSISKHFLAKVSLLRNSAVVGYIDFESDTSQRLDLDDARFSGERLLKKIKLYQVSNGSGVLLKQFELGFGYFGSAQTELFGYRRLKLKTIRELSIDSTIEPNKPPYIFEYEGESATMPRRFSSGIDHWGFYNGKEGINMFGGSPTLIPTVLTSANYLYGYRGLGADRNPDFSSGVLTVLNKIIYPTGGYSSFEYEENQYDQSSVTKAAGGVRIKKITDYATNGSPAEIKVYSYVNADNTSSGYPPPMPTYDVPSEFNFTFRPFYVPPGTDPADVDPNYYRYSVTIKAGSILSLGSVQGSHIGYTRVTESKIRQGSYDTLGKTVYEYHISGFSEVDEHLGNGDLEKQSTYDAGGNLLEELTNTYVYEDDFTSNVYVYHLLPTTVQSSQTKLYKNYSTGGYMYVDEGAGTTIPSGYVPIRDVYTQYDLVQNTFRQQSRKLTAQTKRVFDISAGTSLAVTKRIVYGNSTYNYPTLIKEVDSRGDTIYTSIKHVGDFAVSCSPTSGSAAASVKEMQDSNMVSVPIETVVYKRDGSGNNQRYLGGRYLEYKLGLPIKMYVLQTRPVLSSIVATDVSCTTTPAIDEGYKLDASMEYDDVFNLVEESKVNDITISYLWDYSNMLPVAKSTNALHGAIAYCSFETASFSGNWDFAFGGIGELYGSVTGKKAYSLPSGNIERTGLSSSKKYVVSFWAKNGSGTVYINGVSAVALTTRNGWTLYEKTITGSSTVTVSGTGVVDELRLFPENSQIVTFTYEPLIGITSQCDANNRITYYEYDSFNRLLRIRDMDRNIIKSFNYSYNEAQ